MNNAQLFLVFTVGFACCVGLFTTLYGWPTGARLATPELSPASPHVDRTGQLAAFAAWERLHYPDPTGKPHIAEWALAEIESCQRVLAWLEAQARAGKLEIAPSRLGAGFEFGLWSSGPTEAVVCLGQTLSTAVEYVIQTAHRR